MINVGLFVGVSILSLADIYVWSRMYGTRICFKDIRFYFGLCLMCMLGILNSLYVNGFIRIIFSVISLIFSNYIIFRRKFNESIVSTIFCYFMLTISDVLFAILLVLFFQKNTGLIKDELFATLIGNVVVSFIFVLISYIPFIKKIYLKLVDLTENLKLKNIIKLCLLIIISINFLLAFMYYELKSVYVVIINTVLLLIYSYIVYRTLNEKSNNMMIKAENDSLMHSLHQYEDMVDRQRVDNHENKNQLLIIKNMIKKNDKDVVKYIDTIVKDEKEDDEVLYTRVKTIPSGGLQGIIYQKMLVMKDEKIVFSLDVSRDVRKIDLDDFSMEDNYRLCKIVGVLLDNAIEESRKIDDKCIMISLYVDDGKLVIDVSNRFSGKLDLDKLDEEGYTTKGDGHGYGLSLVKKIMSETDIFENERSIKKDVFKQVIKVKIKNT